MDSTTHVPEAPHRLSSRLLALLIELGLSPTDVPGVSFQDEFRSFAEACFTRSLERRYAFGKAALEEPVVDKMVLALEGAVEEGILAPLRFPVRLSAITVLTSLTSLERQVVDGFLSPAQAAEMLATTFFEGLQSDARSAVGGAGSSRRRISRTGS